MSKSKSNLLQVKIGQIGCSLNSIELKLKKYLMPVMEQWKHSYKQHGSNSTKAGSGKRKQKSSLNTFRSSRLRPKSSSFYMFLHGNISTNDCDKELFQPSKDSASLCICNEKKFWFWVSDFLICFFAHFWSCSRKIPHAYVLAFLKCFFGSDCLEGT